MEEKERVMTLSVWATASSPSIFMINVYFLLLLNVHSGLVGGMWVGRGSDSHCSHSGTQAGGDSTIWIVLATVVEESKINN